MLQADKWRKGELWGISLIIGFHKIETDTSVVCVSARNERYNYAHRIITLSNASTPQQLFILGVHEVSAPFSSSPQLLRTVGFSLTPFILEELTSSRLCLWSLTHRASNFPQTFFFTYQLENKFLCCDVGQHSWLNSVAHI